MIKNILFYYGRIIFLLIDSLRLTQWIRQLYPI
jgi:hypothetical protein